MPVSRGVHDIGGALKYSDQDISLDDDKVYAHWERSIHAVLGIMIKKGCFSLDEHRRAIEALPNDQHDKQSYYEKWAGAIASLSTAKGIFTQAELSKELGDEFHGEPEIKFRAGDIVRVHDESSSVRWRRPHIRTPGYLFGLVGRVERDCCGLFADPESRAYAEPSPRQPLYRVRFFQLDLWEGYTGSELDSVDVEVYQPWLSLATEGDLDAQRHKARELHRGLHIGVVQHEPLHAAKLAENKTDPHSDVRGEQTVSHDHHHDDGDDSRQHNQQQHHHHHSHDDDETPHVHEARAEVEIKAAQDEGDDSAQKRLAEAIIRVLIGKGVISHAEIARALEVMDSKSPAAGSRLVARAWLDPAFRSRLLEDGNAAVAELGLDGSNWAARADAPPGCTPKEKYGTVLTIIENTPEVHNVIVCTLCSCYPIAILGMSPSWYKSRAYRSRVVRDPRRVLSEFGLNIPLDVTVRVHDSTADCRYLVIPVRPRGTEGWDEERLAALVTRDSMIGVARAIEPSEGS